MKRLIILMCTISTLIVAQDAAGTYKLSGVDVLYTFITRYETELTVTDAYGFGITTPLVTIPQGVPFTSKDMRLDSLGLVGFDVTLFVTLNEDGTGSIAEGSYYPDVNTITNEDGDCETIQQVLPVNDSFTYTSNNALGIGALGYNVLGMPGISQDITGMGGLGLSGSITFEDYPMIPEHPTLCGPDGSCFPFTIGDIDGSGTLAIYPEAIVVTNQ